MSAKHNVFTYLQMFLSSLVEVIDCHRAVVQDERRLLCMTAGAGCGTPVGICNCGIPRSAISCSIIYRLQDRNLLGYLGQQ